MAQYGMEKSPPLRGEVRVQRSKNAVLPMMACAVLTREELELADVPRLTDVDGMAALLSGIGVQVSRAPRCCCWGRCWCGSAGRT